MKKVVCNGDKDIFPYIARVPSKMHDKMPLIILLHGAGERGNGSAEQIDRVEVHGFSHLFTDDAEIDCVLVQPQCKEESFWVAHIQEIRNFVNDMIVKFNADPDRVYLTGLSMGGYGTWYTALAFPEMFAAIAPICGGGMPWFSYVLKMPIWAWHGSVDNVVLPSNSIDMINQMKNRKDVKFNLEEGVGHGVWERAYKQPLLDWLLAQKRGQEYVDL